MVCCAVILGSRQKRSIVRALQTFHEHRDELVGGQAANAPIFWRHYDVEAASGARDQPLFCQSVQGKSGRGGGDPKLRPQFRCREVVSAIGGKLGDEITGSGFGYFPFHMQKVLLFDILGKRLRITVVRCCTKSASRATTTD